MNRVDLIKQAAGPMPPFIKELRQAIRDQHKTQTRRLMKPQPYEDENGHWFFGMEGFRKVVPEYMLHHCKYGQPGQVRYLREPLIKDERGFARYEDDDTLVLDEYGDVVVWRWKKSRLAQIFLPRNLARTFVKLDAIRGEQLHEISAPDAVREGIKRDQEYYELSPAVEDVLIGRSLLIDRFARLWDQINAARGYQWQGNWWVWVLVFSLIDGGANV